MTSNLRGKLKRSYSVIKNRLGRRDTSPWLHDNFYLIDKHYRAVADNKKALKCARMYRALERYCEECDYEPRVDELTAFLRAENTAFDYNELSAVSALLSVCSVNKASFALEENDGEKLAKAVKMLISLSDPRYADIIPAVWVPEKVISEFEEGYRHFDDSTKAQYRALVAAYAKNNAVGELAAAKTLIAQAKKENVPLGTLLFRPKKAWAVAWMTLTALLFVCLFALSFWAIGWVSLILCVPFGIASAAVADQIISAYAPVFKAPRMDLESVPDDAKTLVTVAALLSGGKGDERVFESLRRFSYMNPDDNIYFCLLADLPDSKDQFRLEDSEIIENARKSIDELNRLHGNRFCLFFRERVLNKSENRFGGWERKRGAVCELVSHIVRGGKTEYYGGDFIRRIKYILTLDSDTNLSVGSVREMVFTAIHPANRPRLSKGKVVSGYGIIQPTVRTELSSAYRTGFSRLISGAGGADIYANAEFRRSQNLFGSGSFCGKGLIDVRLFDELVANKLPEGRILSHDVVEGSILRTLCASDITLTDSTPGNTVSFFRRQHRWLRGDFQNLYFLQGGLLNAFSKLRILATVLRHTAPVFSVAALITGCFFANTDGLALFILAYSQFFLPSGISVVRFVFSGSAFGAVRFFSNVYTLLTQTLMRLMFELTSSARQAVLVLHAYALAATRMITGKNTLEWTTAAQTEKLSSGLGKYVLDSAVSAVLGLAMLIFARPPFMRFCGLLFFVYPLVSAVLSRPINGGEIARPKLSDRQKNILTAHVSDMFRFYSENVGEKTNFLPPDNLQLSPVACVAMRTSPTNIGFYLVSLLAARDLGIISTLTMYEKLESSLTVIEGLEKFEGNLYNWYDLKNLSVLGNHYVSTVDSGNFIVMLIALKEGLKEYSQEDERLETLISRCDRLVSETDLTPLYDKRRELFRIGIRGNDGRLDEGCYDMLMSEARMTAYYAVASSEVPKKHWQSLGRTLTHKSGYMGMMSWSGTAFEYFMPQLFLPLYRDSFLYESVAFSLMVQRSENRIWGVSESGYYSFDSDMNYQYKANGIQTLALRRIASDERVISPYSTYLSLCVCGNIAMKNLESLENRGMYGKYGLYEALDVNGESAICVKSYMAHHVGMSIIAALNAVKDNVFVRRFMQDKRMGSARELLQEKIPVDAYVFGDNYGFEPEKHKSVERRGRTQQPDIHSPSVAMLVRGDMSALVSDSGHIGLRCGERLLTNTFFDRYSLRFTMGVVFSRGGRSFGCAPLYGKSENFGFEQRSDSVSHIASGKDFTGRVRYSLAKSCNCFIVNTRAENLKKYDVSLVFEPVLEKEKNFRSHISFTRLFLESEYDTSRRILYFHRRSREDGHHVFTLAVAFADKDTRCDFLTSREQFAASSVASPLDYASAAADCKVGECIDPFCLFRASDSDGGRAVFLITCGHTKGECERNIRIARNEKSNATVPPRSPLFDRLLPALLYGGKGNHVKNFSFCGIGDLWSRSISGDYPLAVVTLGKISPARTRMLLQAFSQLVKACIRSELVFIAADSDNYNRPVEAHLRETCSKLGLAQYIGRGGGIFILREDDISADLKNALIGSASFFSDLDREDTAERYSPREELSETVTSPQNALRLPIPNGGILSKNGFFVRDGFTVDKSRLPDAPYSFVLTGFRFSTVVTQSSLGYTFFDNARERRLCAFCGDSRSLDDGERIFALSNGRKYDLCAVSAKAVYEKGRVCYFGEINGNEFTLTVTVPPKYPVKLINVRYRKEPLETRFELRPVMGDSVFPINGIEIKEFQAGLNSCIMFRNTFGMTFPEGRGFAGVQGGRADADSCALSVTGRDMVFFLGACMTEGGAVKTAARVDRGFFESALGQATEFAQRMIPQISVSAEKPSRDAMINFFLPYQVAACRFYARGSFYQSGGAYGFRDQLQDCLALIYSSPRAVRTHIIRCCAHQYSEGCVMHWWHTRHFGRVNRGIKSNCSDDMLYLPLVTADYLEKTGDHSLLDEEIRYLVSPPLNNGQERYEQPSLSEEKESVYRHCLRALDYAYRLGKNGLILMGSCDWNDGFSLVGEKGIGESVFSTLLFVITAQRFAPIAEARGDKEIADRYKKQAEQLKQTVEEKAYFGDRYARAICDDGTVLGVAGCKECEIDILSQAFAAMAGLDPQRTRNAMLLAFSMLYDGKNRIFKLFSPPFTDGNVRVGYIRGYVAGIRENGGQYTHGALWGALGCIAAGLKDEALKILECVDPALRSEDKELGKRYKIEPYAVAADIYSGEKGGRGGWSWYTGAASWYYRIMIEFVFGLKQGAGRRLISAKPLIAFDADISFDGARVRVSANEKFKEPLLNGKAVAFPLTLPVGDSELQLPLV